MMPEYLRYAITAPNQDDRDLLVAILSDMGVEGFEETDELLFASGVETELDSPAIESYLKRHCFEFTVSSIKSQNWNEVWESNFQPVQVGNFVTVRASFHPALANTAYDIVITPKMSFGTGHHATTYMMIQMMQEVDFKNKRVFDFGSGTGILAILAEKLGSEAVVACDYDEWCILNAGENIGLNGCHHIKVIKNDRAPEEGEYDVILANINRNIILENLQRLSERLALNGNLLISGFLATDEPDLAAASSNVNLKITSRLENNGWICLRLTKSLPSK